MDYSIVYYSDNDISDMILNNIVDVKIDETSIEFIDENDIKFSMPKKSVLLYEKIENEKVGKINETKKRNEI
jgi:hypothetical protein